MKKNVMSLLIAASISFVLCGCGVHNAVVTVNGEAITKAQYEKAFDSVAKNSMFAQMGIDVKKDENSFIHLMLKDRVINELIIKTLIDQELDKRKIKISKEDMDKELKNIIDKVGSKEKFNKLLKDNGVSTSQFKKDLSDEVKIKKLVDSLAVVSISDNEAKKFYDDNKDKFVNPEKVRASHILVSANPDEIKAELVASEKGKNMSEAEIATNVNQEISIRKEKAQKLLAEVKKNQNEFAKIAKENSDDTATAQQGGDLGFFDKNVMVEPFSKVAFSMKPNTVSEVVQTPYGYHIILVTDRQAAGVESFDKVRSEIKEFLINQEKIRNLQQFVDTLKNTAKVEYKDASFDPKNIQKKISETRSSMQQPKDEKK